MYKILNEKWKHHDFQYKLGLNVDTQTFNPSGSYQPGGLYYTTAEFIPLFLEYRTQIAEISIPADAQVYADPEGNKWKADKLIIDRVYPTEDWDKWNDLDFCLAAVRQNGLALKYILDQTDGICMIAVRQNGELLWYVKNQTPEICLAAVQRNGEALELVKNQTPEICLAAVKQKAYVLEFVLNQTPEICRAAVHSDGYALEFVLNQTPEICLAAVQQNGLALEIGRAHV